MRAIENKWKLSRVTVEKSNLAFCCSAVDSPRLGCALRPRPHVRSGDMRAARSSLPMSHSWCTSRVFDHLYTLPPEWAIIDLTSHARSEHSSSSQQNSTGSLDTASLRSSSVPWETRLTRTPRHPLVSREHAADRALLVQNMEHASSAHLSHLAPSLAPWWAARPTRNLGNIDMGHIGGMPKEFVHAPRARDVALCHYL